MIIFKIKPIVFFERTIDISPKSIEKPKVLSLEGLRNEVDNKKLSEIKALLPTFQIGSDGIIKSKNTGKVYAKIDIATFRQLPISSNFVHTRNSGEDEGYPIYAVYEKSKDGSSVYKEGKNVYFSDKNGVYVYLGNSNVISHFEGSNSKLEKLKVPEKVQRQHQYQDDSSIDYFISNCKIYDGSGHEVYIFPDGKKWDQSVKIHGDFGLIETADGSLYVQNNTGSGLERLPFKISEVVIQKKVWETLENPKNGVHISIKVKRTGKIIPIDSPYAS